MTSKFKNYVLHFSHLTERISIRKLKNKNLLEDGGKDVTEEAVFAVTKYLLTHGKGLLVTLDSKQYGLRLEDVTEAASS